MRRQQSLLRNSCEREWKERTRGKWAESLKSDDPVYPQSAVGCLHLVCRELEHSSKHPLQHTHTSPAVRWELHGAEHTCVYRTMRGIQKINKLEVVQGRLDFCIPKQEMRDALQYAMEGSCLNGISVQVLCTAIVQLLTAVQMKQSLVRGRNQQLQLFTGTNRFLGGLSTIASCQHKYLLWF